jgi:hypothetical protein
MMEILYKQAKDHWHEFLMWTKDILREDVRELLVRYITKYKINLYLLCRLSYEPALSAPYGNTRN